MNDKSKALIVLPVICAVAAILLAFVNLVTAPKIEEYENSLTLNALSEVANGNSFSERVDVTDNQYISYYYELKSASGLAGYILGLKTSGYGGEITLVASLDTKGSILSVKLLSNNETPGVGKRAENEGYMDMFIGTGSSSNPVPLEKGKLSESNVALVSGATLTFAGISKALNAASDFVRSI